jgi:hypothetical protein
VGPEFPAACRRLDNRAVRVTAQQGARLMKPIALTDGQLLAIQRAADPLHPEDRGPYLEKVAENEIGDGLVGRVVREAQRQFLRVPEVEPRRALSRWDRDPPRFERASKRAFYNAKLHARNAPSPAGKPSPGSSASYRRTNLPSMRGMASSQRKGGFGWEPVNATMETGTVSFCDAGGRQRFRF